MLVNPPQRSFWLILALSALAPLLLAALWGDVYADAAYEAFQRSRAIATGQGWSLGGASPLYTLLLAVAAWLRLPLPFVAAALSVVGWTAALAAWFLIGLALDRPTFSVAAVVLLALHPQQGRALGLEAGLVLGLLGLVTLWTVWGRDKAAVVTALVLTATQPMAFSFALPLFVGRYVQRRSSPPLGRPHFADLSGDALTVPYIAASLAVGAVCYAVGCAVSVPRDGSRLTVPLLAALQLIGALGFSFLVPHLDWLASPVTARHTLPQAIVVLGLAGLVLWQGRALAQAWRLRASDRLALYKAVGEWIHDNALLTETVAAEQAGLVGYLCQRTTVRLPDTSQVSELGAAIESARPDYCITLNGLAWHGVRSQPWFQEHYQQVHQLATPYDTATPLTVFRYTSSPYDEGEVMSTTVTFRSDAGEQIELTGYRVDDQRITPDEPLHLTLFWQAATTIQEPLLLVLRLVDATTDQVWTQVENPEPGGLETDLWDAGTRTSDRYALVPPPDVPAGDYVLDVAFYLSNGRPLSAYIADRAVGSRAAFAQVHHPPNVSAVPLTPDYPLTATFGSEIELVGYDVPGRVAPGRTLRVALYWHALQPVPLDYKVFVHLLGPEGQLLTQDDSMPVGWTYPTTRWRPGDSIRDEHLLAIPPSAPRGDYWLAVGLYDAATGERSVVYDAAEHRIPDRCVMLQQIKVR